jgi:four helix bundle protein
MFGFSKIEQINPGDPVNPVEIAEGFDRGTNKDFVKFLFIARGSAAEVRSMLYVALDQGYLSEEEFEECRNLCIRCSQIIWGLIKSVRRKSDWVTGIK